MMRKLISNAQRRCRTTIVQLRYHFDNGVAQGPVVFIVTLGILGVIAALNSVIAFFYYFRVVVEMWFRPVVGDDERPVRLPHPLTAAIAITSVLVLVVGVFPQIFGRVGDAAF